MFKTFQKTHEYNFRPIQSTQKNTLKNMLISVFAKTFKNNQFSQNYFFKRLPLFFILTVFRYYAFEYFKVYTAKKYAFEYFKVYTGQKCADRTIEYIRLRDSLLALQIH